MKLMSRWSVIILTAVFLLALAPVASVAGEAAPTPTNTTIPDDPTPRPDDDDDFSDSDDDGCQVTAAGAASPWFGLLPILGAAALSRRRQARRQ